MGGQAHHWSLHFYNALMGTDGPVTSLTSLVHGPVNHSACVRRQFEPRRSLQHAEHPTITVAAIPEWPSGIHATLRFPAPLHHQASCATAYVQQEAIPSYIVHILMS